MELHGFAVAGRQHDGGAGWERARLQSEAVYALTTRRHVWRSSSHLIHDPLDGRRAIHIPSIWMLSGWQKMVDNVHQLRPKPNDSEKITINLGFVDLGHIDLMEPNRLHSNRNPQPTRTTC